MNYLSDKHKQLSESQQSGLMLWFGQLPMDKKAVAIGLSLTVGIGSAAMAWQGTRGKYSVADTRGKIG